MKRRDCLVAGVGAALSGIALSESAAVGSVVEWPTLRLLDGSALEPASWRDGPAVVVLWATFCPFCKRHNAHIDKLHAQTRGQGLRVLGVALDKDEQKVRQYMVSNGYRFPVAMDAGQLRHRLTARRVIPMTFLLDRQGRLVQAIPGEMFEEDVLELAQALHRRGG